MPKAAGKLSKSKSRNGCQRCKTKRLKCDESKPTCKNCANRNVQCPGYKKSLKWSTKYEVFSPDPFDPFSEVMILTSKDDKTETTVKGGECVKDVREAKAEDSPPSSSAKPAEPCPNAEDSHDNDEASEHSLQAVPALDDCSSSIESQESISITDSGFSEVSVAECNDDLILEDFITEETDLFGDELGSTHLSEAALDTIKRVYNCHWSDKKPVLHDCNESFRPSKNLLRRYYGLPASPQLRMLSDHSTILVEHYFREICGVFSSFDSQLNPFRVTIGRIWDSTPSIFYAIQSMAAAQLANTYPKMSVTGLEMQRKAYSCLNQELRLVDMGIAKRERILLAVLLLGLSACWHDSSDLGLTHLAAARSLIVPKLIESEAGDDRTQRQNQFFEEALIYWEMLMGFVSQGYITEPAENSFDYEEFLSPEEKYDPCLSDGHHFGKKLLPHPWTGVAPKIQMLFAEVGRLIRRERLKYQSPLLVSFEQMSMDKDLILAAKLEDELLSVELPRAEDLLDFGDENTSKEDFLTLAQAYRCAGLLEIYRVFPTILSQRLGREQDGVPGSSGTLRSFLEPTEKAFSGSACPALWLNSLALYIVHALETMSAKSGTSCLQPILLVAAGSELRFVSSLDYFDFYANDAKVIQARCFVETRFREFALRLPAKPLRKMLNLVKEVWRRADIADGTENADVFWIDVMIENGWETVMG